MRDLLPDVRCRQVVQDFLSTAEVGRLVPAEENAGGEASEWERRERRERGEVRQQKAEELGAGGEEPLFLPTPSVVASAGEVE